MPAGQESGNHRSFSSGNVIESNIPHAQSMKLRIESERAAGKLCETETADERQSQRGA